MALTGYYNLFNQMYVYVSTQLERNGVALILDVEGLKTKKIAAAGPVKRPDPQATVRGKGSNGVVKNHVKPGRVGRVKKERLIPAQCGNRLFKVIWYTALREFIFMSIIDPMQADGCRLGIRPTSKNVVMTMPDFGLSSMSDLIKQKSISLEVWLLWMQSVAEDLRKVHQVGVHLDIKPENIVGGRLVDWGSARFHQEIELGISQQLTTPQYQPGPMLLSKNPHHGLWVDMYSYGLSFLEVMGFNVHYLYLIAESYGCLHQLDEPSEAYHYWNVFLEKKHTEYVDSFIQALYTQLISAGLTQKESKALVTDLWWMVIYKNDERMPSANLGNFIDLLEAILTRVLAFTDADSIAAADALYQTAQSGMSGAGVAVLTPETQLIDQKHP